ncbi:deleted in malignant brain tumors 1 protein-like isoform X2 [Centropristis striata]|uniref:deleted in malignant brain tumors 1 protein-like isoform X2 n=1 Tax=Centropristis striata TaxID=184440 RepID=UPI0027DFB7BF|nr:deleted in malignant brain tumors 1 protein-like isoform X2 [Centropristis striata]
MDSWKTVIASHGGQGYPWGTTPGSCRYNCGWDLGSCSCDYDCEWRGSCCSDYRDYCMDTTYMPETTTDLPSCLYNCGSYLGSCSCESSCHYYGSCCPDYNYYCPMPTTTLQPDTTDTDITHWYTCQGNCGIDMGICSCTSSCEYRGNCCYHYRDYCLDTTADLWTTGQPSCRYNCGWDMGSCSCRSSCLNYGNCCDDFYSYCDYSTTEGSLITDNPSCHGKCGWDMGSCSCTRSCVKNHNCCNDYYGYCYNYHTTEEPETAISQPSCGWYCGSDMGSCSCASSCVYYGNCCNDYYDYCYYYHSTVGPETATAPPCGGSLFGSGTFSSPNHPDHYHDNAYCVWQLRTSFDQRIFLSFTYLQLENCCDCDYVSIYDGPSVGSRYLGKVCNDSLSTFYSTSNYMTVLFRTDMSVVARGFNAEFISSLPPSSGRVDCSSDNMNIVIDKSYLNSLGYDAHNLYLSDPHCRPQISSYSVVFSFPINTCGNVREFQNGRVVYTNTIRAYSSNSGEITRQSHLKMNVSCRMEQDSVSQIMYVVHDHDNTSITGTGRFNTSMDFYTSSSFFYKVTEVPYKVKLNQRLYVQVNLRRSDSSLVLFLDTCVTSPSPHDFQSRSYDLVRNGCPVDDTYAAYSTGTRPYARFRFQAFQFLRASDTVYIQCKVLICQASDYNSRCRQGCNKRVARDLGSEHDSETLVLGPIQLEDPEQKEEETQEQDEA